MAAIQSIRKHGILLIVVIAVALLAFITEEFFRARQQNEGANANVIGTIDGKKISTQEYSDMIDAVKFLRGQATYSEAEEIQIKEQAWEQYVSNKLVAQECDKLGLTVTDQELSQLLNDPRVAITLSQMLQNTPFVDPRTGFNVEAVKQLLSYKKQAENDTKVSAQEREYINKMYAQWLTVEKTIKAMLLQEKYKGLLTASFTSNPIEAKMNFDARNNTKDIFFAMVPYAAIADKDVTCNDEDLKAKYDELKENFKMPYAAKDIVYIAYDVTPSEADKAAIAKKMDEIKAELDTTDNVAALVNRTSAVAYNGLYRTKDSYPEDVKAYLDSMGVGSTKAYSNPMDNTVNIVKLYGKTTQADSIQICQLVVPGKDKEDIAKRADSIMSVISASKNDSTFAQLAQKFGQSGEATWMESRSYEAFQMDEENASVVKTITGMAAGEIRKIEVGQGAIIAWVKTTRNAVAKYDAAVIKRTLDFSSETSKKERNRFSKFIADNQTIAALEKNAAKNGYEVKTINDLTTSGFYSSQLMQQHPMISWINNDAKRWIFDEAKDEEVSIMYEGGNGSHFLVVAVKKSYDDDYKSFDDVKENLKPLVLNDKKAEKILANLKGVNSVEGVRAKYPEASVDTATNVNFFLDDNPYMQVDPILLGSVAKAKMGQFVGPKKGTDAVFAYKVIKETPQEAGVKYDERREMKMSAYRNAQYATTYAGRYDMVTPYLKLKAKVVDNRYRFY